MKKIGLFDFVNKNQPNDFKICCKSSSSLVWLIETGVDLVEEFKEFEGAFEKDEVMEFQVLN